MSKKLAFTRYIWFIDQARRGRHPNARTLAEKFELSNVQAQRDVEFMRERLNAPLAYIHDEKGFILQNHAFNLPTVWIEDEELLLFAIAKELIRDAGSKKILNAFFEKILPVNSSSDIKALERVVSFKGTGYYQQNANILNRMIEALLAANKVEVLYRAVFAPDPKPNWLTITPLHLLFYKTNWYVLARYKKKLRTFALARIDDLKIKVDTHHEKLSPEEIKKLIAGTYGIFVTDEDHPVVPVKLRFAASYAHYIATIVFHPEQKQTWLADGRIEVTFPSTINRELTGEVMRHIDVVEIVEPIELRTAIKGILDKAVAGMKI